MAGECLILSPNCAISCGSKLPPIAATGDVAVAVLVLGVAVVYMAGVAVLGEGVPPSVIDLARSIIDSSVGVLPGEMSMSSLCCGSIYEEICYYRNKMRITETALSLPFNIDYYDIFCIIIMISKDPVCTFDGI